MRCLIVGVLVTLALAACSSSAKTGQPGSTTTTIDVSTTKVSAPCAAAAHALAAVPKGSFGSGDAEFDALVTKSLNECTTQAEWLKAMTTASGKNGAVALLQGFYKGTCSLMMGLAQNPGATPVPTACKTTR